MSVAGAIKEKSKTEAEGGDVAMGAFDDLIGTRLRYAYLVMRRNWLLHLDPLGLTQTQCATMWLLDANPSASQTELAEALDLDRVTMIGVIDKLKAKKLIERTRSELDRRRFNLCLSAKGQEVFAEVRRRIRNHDDEFSAILTSREREVFMECLAKIGRYRRPPVRDA